MLSQSFLLLNSDLRQLEKECEQFKGMRYASSTQRTHKIQLETYFEFCRLFDVTQSCSSEHICLYITFLARKLSFVSIRQYISALQSYFLTKGLIGIDYEDSSYKACLAGIRRTLGESVSRAPALLPVHLIQMFKYMELDSDGVAIRAAILVLFRALLRQGHVTGTHNALRRSDFTFSSTGMTIRIRKSKNIQFQQKILLIPIAALKHKSLCAVYWVRRHFGEIVAKPEDTAFRISEGEFSISLTYSLLLATMRLWAEKAKLELDTVSTHSLRRGGATYFRSCGTSVEDIGDRGNWCSEVVHKYLDRSLEDRYNVDVKVAEMLDRIN